jgi:hypothetical protein
MRSTFLLAVGLFTEVGFLGGLLKALSLANIPHTPAQLGQATGVAVLFIISQLFQLWARRSGHKHLVRGVQGLARAVRGLPLRRKARKTAPNAL